MRKAILLSVMVLAFSAFAVSDPVSCSSGTLADYMALNSSGGCTVDNLVFTNFMFNTGSTGGAATPSPSGIGVSPIISGSNAGLDFDAGLVTSSNQTADVVIDYTVSALSGSITDSGLTISAGITGTGTAAVDETQCLGALLPCSTGTAISLHATAGSPADSSTFAGVPLVDVIKDIIVNGGSSGTASISAEVQTYSSSGVVPEPASLALFGTGLVIVAFALRRKIFSER